MSFQRLLCGAVERYSRLFRLLNVQQNSSISTQRCVSGLCSRILVHKVRPGAVHRQLTSSTQPSRDVTLFLHDRTRFFRLLSLFCGGQCVFWTYLGHFAFTGLRNAQKGKPNASTTTTTTTTGLAGIWSFEMNLGSNTWRYGFTMGCLGIAAGIVGLGVLFCRRSVSQVILHQGGKMVTVSTQSPLGLGRGRKITVPLSQVACHAHRHESPSFIPLRVKGHKFYYLLDKEGTINNSKLFDFTVGAYRTL